MPLDSQREYNTGSMISGSKSMVGGKKTQVVKGGRKKTQQQRPIQNLIDKYGAGQEDEQEQEKAKLKFPLLKGDDDLDILLTDMLGPEEAKKFMYGSDHASHAHNQTDAAHASIIDVSNLDTNTNDEANQEIMSAAKGRKSVKSKSTLKNKDEISISAHGTEVGGRKQQKKMKWNSVRQ